MKNNVKLILTDIGGVIYKSNGIRNAVANFLKEEEESKKVKKIVSLFYDSFNGRINEEEFWRQFSEITNHNIESSKKLIDYIEYKINYQYINYLHQLSKKNIKIGIISDINSIIYKIIRNNIKDFESIFDNAYIFLSYLEKDSKYLSGKKYFEEIIKKINMNPKDVIFIDDNLENIKNAELNGLIGIKYGETENEDTNNKKIIKQISEIVNRGSNE